MNNTTAAQKVRACSTGYSQAVTHPSTRPARHWLTSVIGREPVYSAWYGRRHYAYRKQLFYAEHRQLHGVSVWAIVRTIPAERTVTNRMPARPNYDNNSRRRLHRENYDDSPVRCWASAFTESVAGRLSGLLRELIARLLGERLGNARY